MLGTDCVQTRSTTQLDHGAYQRATLAARLEIALRLRRRKIFDNAGPLLRDPVWDGLLELLLAEAEGRRVLTKGLCLVMHRPPTTSLRWIARMEKAGLITRTIAENDHRRAEVSMTETGRSLVVRALDLGPQRD